MTNFGFIISRHVNSEKTNKYWNECVRCIQKVHAGIKIVIIDDNSNYDFVKPETEYDNVEYVQSEYKGRGELLPYYYFWKNRYWDNAVLLHDSVFIQKRIPYKKFKMNVMPLWHFGSIHKENTYNTLRIVNYLKNNYLIKQKLLMKYNNHDVSNIMSISNKKEWNGCFGVQTYINLEFLSRLQEKYDLFNMLNCVTTRPDRCCLERIMGIIFFLEDKNIHIYPSLFGDIHSTHKSYSLTYDQHREIIKNNGFAKSAYVKVWSGR
jgi:hypothetical protein